MEHFITHLAIWEAPLGPRAQETEWGEHVTDAEYDRSTLD